MKKIFRISALLSIVLGIIYSLLDYGIGLESTIFLFISIVLFLFSNIIDQGVKTKKLQTETSENIIVANASDINSENIIIPETCPNCKSPNSKKIRICEWCGNQII
jgi:hypothetical protein